MKTRKDARQDEWDARFVRRAVRRRGEGRNQGPRADPPGHRHSARRLLHPGGRRAEVFRRDKVFERTLTAGRATGDPGRHRQAQGQARHRPEDRRGDQGDLPRRDGRELRARRLGRPCQGRPGHPLQVHPRASGPCSSSSGSESLYSSRSGGPPRRAGSLRGGFAVIIVVSLLSGLPCLCRRPPRRRKAPDADALRAGRNYIATPRFSEAEDKAVLALFKGLRVADVVDGMDAVGLVDTGTMDAEIHALWRDTASFTHRFAGIAVTARYVPTQQPTAGVLSTEAYDAWAGDWYDKRSPESFIPLIRPGHRARHRRGPARRRRLDRVLQHPRLAEPRLRRRRHGRHGPRHRRDHHPEGPALPEEDRPRHPAGPQRARIRQPARRLRRRPRRPGRRRRGRRRRRCGRAPGQGRGRGPIRPEDHGRGQGGRRELYKKVGLKPDPSIRK